MLVVTAHGLRAGDTIDVLPALAALMLADGRATLPVEECAVHTLVTTPRRVVTSRDPVARRTR